MDVSELEENLFVAGDAKLHGEMCRALSTIVLRVLEIFPFIEAARPRSKSGIQALCSLHVAVERAKTLLQHCSDCSKLYLAITGDSILMKFEKTRCVLQESLKRVEDIVPETLGVQIMEVVGDLKGTVFELDQSEKEAGDQLISLFRKEGRINGGRNNSGELEIFHQAALKLGITSSRTALTERRALKKLIERARAEEDKRKDSVVSYLLHLMRKYSKHFRSGLADDTDSQGSAPCSPTVLGSYTDAFGLGRISHAFERQFSDLSSFNSKHCSIKSENMPAPPEEFRCPISLQLMYDPVIISSGQTYERICIEKWFSDGHITCPKTQQQLPHLCITPNYCVKGLIASWCEENVIPLPRGPPESQDVGYWRLALSECEAAYSRSMGSVESVGSCKTKGLMVVSFEDRCTAEEVKGNETVALDNSSCHDYEIDELKTYESLMTVLYEDNSLRKQHRAVEQLRLLLKDDAEARIYLGANGIVEALVQFLSSAVREGDKKAQEDGTMALFNLAVDNNRNKEMLLSAGVLPLLEEMISDPETCEPATALYLNLSCLDDSKPAIGSSNALPFLVQLLQSDNSASISCKHDTLHTLYNISTVDANIPVLLASGIIAALQSIITDPAGPEGLAWTEKALAVIINLGYSEVGKDAIVKSQGMISCLAAVLDTGEAAEQELVVSCLLILCNGNERCSHMVLQEGVIPALVSVSVTGTTRGMEKAQRLLQLFREQRQHEPAQAPVPQQPQQQQQYMAVGGGCSGLVVTAPKAKQLSKSRSKKFVRSLSSMWKKKNLPVYQCYGE